jgi:hypothetical protein
MFLKGKKNIKDHIGVELKKTLNIILRKELRTL